MWVGRNRERLLIEWETVRRTFEVSNTRDQLVQPVFTHEITTEMNRSRSEVLLLTVWHHLPARYAG